jgi:hypothetical protein
LASGQDTNAVLAEADVEVSNVALNAPANASSGVPFTVQVDTTILNNGPLSPANVTLAVGLSAPPDCTLDPIGYQGRGVVPLTGVADVVSKSWDVTCTDAGAHLVIACARVVPSDLHVVDLTPANDFSDTQATVIVDGDATPVPQISCGVPVDPPAEVCGNGIDDDRDGLVDEEPDTDSDGQTDCVDDDDDDDGFTDAIELYVATDPLDDCSDDPSDAAHPMDMDNDRFINTVDVQQYKGKIPSAVTTPALQRLDLDGSGIVNINDVNLYRGVIPSFCG